MFKRAFAVRFGSNLVPVEAASPHEAARLGLRRIIELNGDVTVGDGVSPGESYRVADLLADTPDEQAKPATGTPTGSTIGRPRRAPREPEPLLPDSMLSPSGWPITNVLADGYPQPRLARSSQRHAADPLPGSVQWRERHLANQVLYECESLVAAAGRLGMTAQTLRKWESSGLAVAKRRDPRQPELPVPRHEQARERRMLAVAVKAYGGDVVKAARAIDMAEAELVRRMAWYGLTTKDEVRE